MQEYLDYADRANEVARAAKNYRRALRTARVLSWGQTAALGAAAASLIVGGMRIRRATRK